MGGLRSLGRTLSTGVGLGILRQPVPPLFGSRRHLPGHIEGVGWWLLPRPHLVGEDHPLTLRGRGSRL